MMHIQSKKQPPFILFIYFFFISVVAIHIADLSAPPPADNNLTNLSRNEPEQNRVAEVNFPFNMLSLLGTPNKEPLPNPLNCNLIYGTANKNSFQFLFEKKWWQI